MNSENLDLQSFWKSFDELSKLELYEVLSFRQSIFVVEQKSWYQDADGLDEISDHLLLKKDEHLVGYLRLTPPGIKYKTPSIGRIALIESLRGLNIGSRLVDEGLKRSSENYMTDKSTISAQEYLIKFYEGHGFKVNGEVYDEDGIPHIQMIRNG
ncbi:GNAT family N-acetyltransferase [SAR86 cluster bacterium]|nr:GNAT family N-acetyltransferase [SAR86 cluster bacterium]